MSTSFGPINITGGNNQNTFGVNSGNQTQNIAGEAQPSTDEILEVIAESIPEESRDEIETEVIEPLRALAALPIVEQKEPTMVQKANALIAKLSPFAPQIAKGLAVFGSAFFKASPITGPWVAGIQALCEKVQTPQEKQA
jgi:hypothetical protein